jgi:nitrogen fixation NifU-like protein
MELDELYQTIILDHSKRPRNFGELPPPATKGEGYNPSCGDEVSVFVNRANDVIEEIRFTGQACAICMASTSLMTVQIKGKTASSALGLKNSFVEFLTQDVEPAQALGNLRALGGVKKFPQRLKCATLGWHALEAALRSAELKAAGSAQLSAEAGKSET